MGTGVHATNISNPGFRRCNHGEEHSRGHDRYTSLRHQSANLDDHRDPLARVSKANVSASHAAQDRWGTHKIHLSSLLALSISFQGPSYETIMGTSFHRGSALATGGTG